MLPPEKGAESSGELYGILSQGAAVSDLLLAHLVNGQIRVWGMAQSVRSLLPLSEDLSLEPQHLSKRQAWSNTAVTLEGGGFRDEWIQQ